MSDNHFLRAVLEVGDKHCVQASAAIYSSNGLKLLERGVRVSSALYSKLLGHNLAVPIENCLSIENTITRSEIRDNLLKLAHEKDFYRIGFDSTLKQYIAESTLALPLPPQMAFKLTLLRERLPDTFTHSLEVALCALIISRHADLSGIPEGSAILAAGLLHDVGMLHLDPAVLKNDGVLAEQDLKHIYSHPVLGYLALKHFEEMDDRVGIAVLEHHERLDGSGYPKGLKSDQISEFGQLLSAAELVCSLLNKRTRAPFPKVLHVVSSLNRGKFNAKLIKLLIDLAAEQSSPSTASTTFDPSYESVFSRLLFLSIAMQSWYEIALHCQDVEIAALIDERIKMLEKRLAALGVDLSYWRMMDAEICKDSEVLGEMAIGAMEGCWQLREIVHEARRKWPNMLSDHSPAQDAIGSWLAQVEEDGSTLRD